nr:Rv3654c family TadE-like protein [Streptomyces sp. ME08-AFT2]
MREAQRGGLRRAGRGWTRLRRLAAGSRGGGDRGSATVWSVGAIAVLCVVFGAVLALGQAVTSRHRAAGGADLAALAAADHWSDGAERACARADRVARAQRARLVRCSVVGQIADVAAASGSGAFAAQVRARAGPPEASALPVPLPPQAPPPAQAPPPPPADAFPSTTPRPVPPSPPRPVPPSPPWALGGSPVEPPAGVP